MMSQPFTGELFFANASGSHYEGPGGPRRLATRKTTDLAQATLFTTTPALFKGEARKRYDQFETKVQLARYGTDCYAFAMLAAGSDRQARSAARVRFSVSPTCRKRRRSVRS